jgi:hypothetical protein
MARNFTVVIPEGVPHLEKKFENQEDLEYECNFGISGGLALCEHGSYCISDFDLRIYSSTVDLKKRVKGEPYHKMTTVKDFLARVNDPGEVGMILDIPICTQALPNPYRYVLSFALEMSDNEHKLQAF